jgi:GNAT superfamily N-acetyltransferase
MSAAFLPFGKVVNPEIPAMIDDITIDRLAGHSEVVPTLVQWFESEWPAYYSAQRVGRAQRDFDSYCNEGSLPVGLVAFHGSSPCGFVALKSEPFATHPQLTPWAGAAYVVPSMRRNGIGAALFRAIELEAARLGYRRLYCATATSMSLLRRCGWYTLDRAVHDAEAMEIFSRDVEPIDLASSDGNSRVALRRMDKTPEKLAFALSVKKDAFGPYIAQRWEWDEQLQRRSALERWSRSEPYEILDEGQAAGVLSVEYGATVVTVHELYVLPEFQRRGIGGQALRRVLVAAAERRLPVTLQCLKWNADALNFYRRHAFVESDQTETHIAMKLAI